MPLAERRRRGRAVVVGAAARVRAGGAGRNGLARLGVRRARAGTDDELALGVAQRGQPAAEDAAGVDVDRVVQPLGLGDRRVAVDDRRRAAVLGRPVVADRQAELVGLAGRLAVQREVAHRARSRGPASPPSGRRGRRPAGRRRARSG